MPATNEVPKLSTLFCLTLRVSTAPLSFNNLLEGLAELWNTLMFTDYKGYNLETAHWKRCIEQGVGEGRV